MRAEIVEAAGQHRTGQGDHDQVADGEVARTADDPARSPAPFEEPMSTWHQRIGFLNPVSSSISTTRPTTSGPEAGPGGAVDVLDLEADPDERLADRVDVGGQAVDGAAARRDRARNPPEEGVVPVGRPSEAWIAGPDASQN